MKRFAGAAALAIVAHSGMALAQTVIIEAPDGPPAGRLERMSPDVDRPARPPGRMERNAQDERPDRPARPRGAEAERPEPRERSAQREQTPQREPVQQREQAQPQQREPAQRREQVQQREQTQERARQDEQNGRRGAEPQQPATRPQSAQPQQPETRPQTPQSAQPQQPANRPAATENARPGTPDTSRPTTPSDTARPGAPAQDENQRTGTAGQRPDATQPNTGTAQQPPAPGTAPGQQSAGAQIAEPERRRIADTVRERVERNELRPERNFGVSVSVGVELPSRVQLQPLPGDIASIRPQYRDYRYTVSEREIVIVDPRSRRVVEVIARDGGGRRGGDVYAVLEQRRDLRRWSRPSSVSFETGVILPAGAPYHDLPVELVERNPNWRGYQYVMTESDEIAIVEPRSRRIVEVVDQNASSQSASAGGGSATAGGTASQPMPAGNGDRRALARIIINDARPGEIQGVEHLKGAVLSQEFALRPIPTEASEQDGQLSGYHYALLGDDVLIVDPRSRQIIDVIE